MHLEGHLLQSRKIIGPLEGLLIIKTNINSIVFLTLTVSMSLVCCFRKEYIRPTLTGIKCWKSFQLVLIILQLWQLAANLGSQDKEPIRNIFHILQ